MNDLAGVLQLAGASHGRHDKTRLYFRFIPRDHGSTGFLVPWKRTAMRNMYVVACSPHDDEVYGRVVDRLGEVDDPVATERYLLYGIRFPSTCDRRLARSQIAGCKTKTLPNVDSTIITIDPAMCEDADDAIGLHPEKGVAVYITDVAAALDRYGLWSHVSDVVSSAYMPSATRHMLCKELVASTTLSRMASRDTLMFQIVDGRCVGCTLRCISVSQCYCYDDESLMHDKTFIAASMASEETCPHAVVARLMTIVNVWVGETIKRSGLGILRHSESAYTQSPVAEILAWGPRSEYVPALDGRTHAQFGTHYAHATSPMRRVVDIVNVVRLKQLLGMPITDQSISFCERQEGRCEEITSEMRRIKRAEVETRAFVACLSLEEVITEGVITSVSVHDGKQKYDFWIPEWSMFAEAWGMGDLELGSSHHLRFHLFKHANIPRHKVRIAVIGCPNVFSLV